MKKRLLSTILPIALLLILPSPAAAFLDTFVCDSAIYSAVSDTQGSKPNVLFIINNSRNMINQKTDADAYDPNVVYLPRNYKTYGVYSRNNPTAPWDLHVDTVDGTLEGGIKVTCAPALHALTEYGFWKGGLNSAGGCSTRNNDQRDFYLGNLVNKLEAPEIVEEWKPNHWYEIGDVVKPTYDSPFRFRVVAIERDRITRRSGATEPDWPKDPDPTLRIPDNDLYWQVTTDILTLTKAVVKQVAGSLRDRVNIGVMSFGDNNDGGWVRSPVLPIGGENEPNLIAFRQAVDSIAGVASNTHEVVAAAIWDAGVYFQGQYANQNLRIGQPRSPAYPSPVLASCQYNHILVLTTGASESSSQARNIIGDVTGLGFDANGKEMPPDGIVGPNDAAKRVLGIDPAPHFTPFMLERRRVRTSVIQFLTYSADLEDAAIKGGGKYALVRNTAELEETIRNMMSGFVNEGNTSFVAPVVPTSPENRSYSGERVYLGFFQPLSQKPWAGNVKKFGLSLSGQVVDATGEGATNADGTFKDTAWSFWTDQWEIKPDYGVVRRGGSGAGLVYRDQVNNPRKIYSNLTATKDLTASGNRFNTSNVTVEALELETEAQRDALVSYIHGFDSYLDNDMSTNRGRPRDWIMGDILHSKPAVVTYNTFAFTEENERSCDINRTMIYVGSNSGMLQAVRDCDGMEEWAFVPDEVLPNLRQLSERPGARAYFVDASPVAWILDKNNNGIIEPENGDRVILIFGLRRGGSAYYALDVTVPDAPQVLWKITPSTPGFEELGQTWSEPQFGRVKIGSESKIVAFVGAGYDINEDGRFGRNGTFPPPTYPIPQETGAGNLTSEGNTAPQNRLNPRGRGVYAFLIADIVDGMPTVATTPQRVWGFTWASSGVNAQMNYPIPSDITVLDSNFNGFADRLYVADSAARLWRFDIGSNNVESWTGTVIFAAGYRTDWVNELGRKAFYRPSVALEHGYTLVAFGTGDRPHPLNTALIDRFYMVKDKGQGFGKERPMAFEPNLFDATENELQDAETTTERILEILEILNSEDNYGWFIRLDQNPGEKILSPPLIFNRVAYFTTFTPNEEASDDPCMPGNLGVSRLYAVNYKTGEAVLNFDTSNDSLANNEDTNPRAVSDDGKALQRSDRSITLGIGIPSGIVVVMPPSGEAKLLIGCGGGLCSEDPTTGGTIFPIYWIRY
jgi:type IV pilus assembly protein PilY1